MSHFALSRFIALEHHALAAIQAAAKSTAGANKRKADYAAATDKR